MLSRNIATGNLFSFFQMFLILIPVCVPYWRSIGLTTGEILEIQAIFGVSVAAFEIPTGYIADIWSRKVSVCIGTFVTGCGFTMLPFATTYTELAVMEVILALGGSLVSGADIAIIYDSIRSSDTRLKVLGNLSWWSLVGEALASLVGGFLVLYSYGAVIWGQVVVGWIPFVVALFFIEPPIEKMQSKNPLKNIGTVFHHLVISDTFLRLIFVNSLVWSLSTFSVVWLLQPYWGESGVPLFYFGPIWAGLMLIAALFSKLTHRIERAWGAGAILLILSLIPSIGFLAMGCGSAAIGVVAGVLFYVSRGLTQVVFQDALNWRTPSAFRATANSARSLLFRLSFGVIGPAIGLAIDRYGLRVALSMLGVVFFVMFLIAMVPLYRRVKELQMDYIPTVTD